MQMCQLSLVNKTVIKHATNASNYKAAQTSREGPAIAQNPEMPEVPLKNLRWRKSSIDDVFIQVKR